MSPSTLADQIAVYDGMRDELEAEHSGEWVVVHDGVVAGFHGSFQTAAADAVARFGRGPYLIREVGGPPLALPTRIVATEV